MSHRGLRLGVLVSGRGSNLQAILDAGFAVEVVVSNRPGARALAIAAGFGVPTTVLPRAAFADAGERDRAIGEALTAAGVQIAILAGYDQLLRQPYFDAYAGRTLNIHPSLLPAHGGRGMLGPEVHRSVLRSGDTETGATVHEVTRELDAGPILAQASVAVSAEDTPETLAHRVLQIEHRLLVATLRSLS